MEEQLLLNERENTLCPILTLEDEDNPILFVFHLLSKKFS